MTAWKMIVSLEADDPGVIHAAKAIKQLLEPAYGRVRTTTIEASMLEHYLRPVEPFRDRNPQPERPEHAGSSYVNGHRRRA